MRRLKRRDICIYTGSPFFELEYGALVEILGMDDNGVNMIVFYGSNEGLVLSQGVRLKNLQYIDHISQQMPDCILWPEKFYPRII